MTDNLLELEQCFNALLRQISPQQQRKLAQQIGRQLAQNQRRRIQAQQNPDGSQFAPRKRKLRSKKGRIKAQAMFMKLRTARFMRTKTTAEGVQIGYTGANAKIANVHQYGLNSRVSPNSNKKVQYDQRELLGFSAEDREMIEDLVIRALMGG